MTSTGPASKALQMIPFAPWPVFTEDEISAAAEVLRSGKVNYWTGPECRRFEEKFSAAHGCKYGISLANGTLALELALAALGIGAGDEVIVPSRTFIATASCVVARGAIPVVADVDAESGNLTPETISAVLSPRTRAIIPVHLAGWPCDMDPILALARRNNLYVIEDCAQAHGATYKGRPVGCFGDCAAFSFCQDKIMTTGGEGGMLVTNDESLWRRAWEYKDHGKSWDEVHRTDHPPGFRWLHASFGSNFRMTEMQAAIGLRQLGKLPDWLARRRANAVALRHGLGQLTGLHVPWPEAGVGHAFYKLYAYLDLTRLASGWDQARIITAVSNDGVPCFAGSCAEIYRERAFSAAGLGPSSPLPVAQHLGQSSLMFLVHPTLDERHMERTVSVVAKILAEAIV